MNGISSTLIDNILTNNLSIENKLGIIYSDLSDHFTIFHFCTLKVKKVNYKKTTEIRMNMSKLNVEKFKCKISESSWDKVYLESDANVAYNYLWNVISMHFNDCFPAKIIGVKQRKQPSNPWYTSDMLKMLRKKNKLYKKYVLSPTPLSFHVYKKYRNHYVHALRSAKKKYYSDKINTTSNNVKGTWKVINQILQRDVKSSQPGIPSVFFDGTNKYESSEEIAHQFNTFFANSGLELVKKITITHNDPLEYIQPFYPQMLSFQPPNIEEISEIIDDLKLSTAGHDGISAFLVKQIKHSILKPLTHIVSLSLATGVVPDDLKVAKVIPLFKADDKACFNNYRPISILPCFSKVFEKVVYKRLFFHINNNSILYKHQYGFRKHHSTYMALSHLLDSVTSALDKNKFICSIFLDLSKAFDTVDHTILLSKLQKYGFQHNVLKWLRNYICDRSQFVCINGCISDRLNIQCGVPQGSVLGPLLFLLYINDLCFVSKDLTPIMFADDTTLLLCHSDFNVLVDQVNEGLSFYDKWFRTNKLSINIKKKQIILFSVVKRHVHLIIK
uniref:Reverse transcriptase domain-containing protein n=1 Tax=Oryzias melastigma TaxID=30732 RepID=A0A3B3DH72_ORYME